MGVKVGSSDAPTKTYQERNHGDQQTRCHKGLLVPKRVPSREDI
jgi:hypothetical protein